MTYEDSKTVVNACVTMLSLAYHLAGDRDVADTGRKVIADLDDCQGHTDMLLHTAKRVQEILA